MHKVKYEIEAKPTIYNHRQYRSRLEARWAAMFDFIGWDFEYEPEPLKTWSPDFLLTEALGGVYIEVKPYSLWSDELMHKLYPYCGSHRIGLIADDLITNENQFFIGKYFNKHVHRDKLLLKDLGTPYYGPMNQNLINRLWIESANKVMYLKP